MSILAVEVEPLAVDARCDENSLLVVLADGREVRIPLEWSPRLQKATPAERDDWRFIGGGVGLHWEAIDEDISIASLLRLK